MESSSHPAGTHDIISSIFIRSYDILVAFYRGGSSGVLREKLQAVLGPLWKSERVSPARVIITGFLLLILLGTVLLMLPLLWGLDGVWLAVVAAEGLALCVTAAFLAKLRNRYHY